MAAGTKRPNLQTAVARRHSLNRKVSVTVQVLEAKNTWSYGVTQG